MSKPTPEEARAALDSARAEEQATINRPLPGWYYPILAAALFVIFALNSIEELTGTLRVVTIVLVLVLAVSVGALVGRFSMNRPGYKGIRIPWTTTTILTMLLAAAFPIAAIVLDGVIGSWVWIASGAALAIMVLLTGIPYQRKHRNG